MKAFSKILALIGAMVFLLAGVVTATSIAPALNGTFPVAGEAETTAFFPSGSTESAFIDWIVFSPGDYAGGNFEELIQNTAGSTVLSDYLYVYQIETYDITNVENLTIYFPTNTVTGAGSYDADLDQWHNSTNFSNLASESEATIDGTNYSGIENLAFGPVFASDNITYDYDGYLDKGEESDIMWLTSAIPPGYSDAAVNNSAQTGGSLPAPVPEPTTILLSGLGLLGMGAYLRRRKTKKV